MKIPQVKNESGLRRGGWAEVFILLAGVLAFWLTAGMVFAQDEMPPDERVVLVPLGKAPKEAPLFFSATVDVAARAGLDEITSEQQLRLKIHQGKTGTFTLGLSGPGEVLSVTGDGLRDWSVRVDGEGARFLDLRAAGEGTLPPELNLVMKTRSKVEKDQGSLLLPAPGNATGFSMTVSLAADAGTDLRVVKADGLLPVDPSKGLKYLATGAADLGFTAVSSGSGARGLELLNASVTGTLAPDGGSVAFRLTGMARSAGEGSAAALFSGVALSGGVSGDGWHVVLKKSGYELIAERAGEFPVSLEFVAAVERKGDWRNIAFTLPLGTVVPVSLEGLGEGVSFERSLAVVPRRDGSVWRGFLPADGKAVMAWKASGAVADGALFFSSMESTDVRIGSGLMRQMTVLDLRVLQGKLGELSVALDGPGEILSVTGEPVLGWSVAEEEGKRRLDVRLSRPIEGSGRIVVEAQSALGAFPVKSESLRMVPRGSLRHNGWLRVANEGAVRIEVVDAKGLIQLTPAQFPGGVDESLRQVFVYRFPSADYTYGVQADQVLPEVGVTEVTVYELAETDRRIFADIELDIREAPLREWELQIPADHAVAAVTGAEVADYVTASEAKDGKRTLKILFKQPVINRQLVGIRLEKNESAKAGSWDLPLLEFPGAKSRRGYVGAVAAPGYRLVAGKTTGLAEVPITFFPKKAPGLQQAFRLREAAWQANLTVEALAQSVQADVFHLYSLKAGSAYGSVLVNYFVVGAPATEWRISVPQGIGNIDVTGQNVGRWRQEGDTVIVPLSRPVLGAGTVLLTFEQPMNARGGDLAPGEVRPLGVQEERGYVQVVSPLQVKFGKPVIDGPLLEIDPSELPSEFRLLSSASTLKAWQYTGRDFKIGMKIEWFEPGKTVQQVVDFLKLSSRISRDGQWVTDARFFVKSKEKGVLRLALPGKASLWEATVDGKPVNARADGDHTLIPLDTQTDPNRAVEIALRYGARADKATAPRLVAPRFDVPVVIGEWTVSGDEGRQLVPKGGTAELVKPGLAENGWDWLARHRRPATGFVLLGILAMVLSLGRPGKVRGGFALLAGILFLTSAFILGLSSLTDARGNAPVLEYAAPVVDVGGEVALEIGNVKPWVARMSLGGCLALLAGGAALVRGIYSRDSFWRVAGLALLAGGCLLIRGGAPLFLALVFFMTLPRLLPDLIQVLRSARKPPVTEAFAALAILTGIFTPEAGAVESGDLKPAESMVQDWQIRDGRLVGSIQLAVRAEAGDRFLLLRSPAVLSGFEGQGLRATKAPLDGADAYFIVADTGGRLTGKASFEMPLANPAQGWLLPGGPAAMRQVTVRWDQAGWEFFSPGAAKVTPLEGLAAGESGAVMVLGPADSVSVQARPKQRDTGMEETRFFAEVSNLYLPGPGVVNGRHRVLIRPAQGRVASLVLRVPDGFTVSDVSDGPAGSWRFDPEKKELRVPVEPAQEQAFGLTIETQQGTSALPVDLALQPLRVEGAAGEIGFMGLAFGEDAQPENITVEGLSRVNAGDFDAALLPQDKNGNPLALLQHAFRYGSGEVSAKLKVTPVAPELRADSWQLVSLGEDRLLVATDLTVNITRSGVFRLALEIPEELEIETATGESLSHWTESRVDGKRVLTLHLAGKTLGRQTFSLSLTGKPPGGTANWQVPRLSLREASRETGVVTIVPERGLQVQAVERRNVSQLDPRSLAEAPQDSAKAALRPGALAFRLLQSDWSIGLAVSRLDPWLTARVFHEATLREGQVISRVAIGYKIENGAMKTVRVRVPGLDATAAGTLRATGPAVADRVQVPGESDLWEIRFQRGIAGETTVVLEYQRTGKEGGSELIEPVVLEQVRQSSYFVALRAGGRLELEQGTLPRGWQREDWAVVHSSLGQMAGNIAPVMAFRVADPEGPLPVLLKRHALADLQKLRVSEGTLVTLMSPKNLALTAVDLKMQVTGKGTLRLKLPKDARLFNVLVNEEGASLVKEGDEWLFYVSPSPEAGRPSNLRFVYSSDTSGGGRLLGPVLREEPMLKEGSLLNVPMENLNWRVLVPEGWRVADHGGDFDLKERERTGSFQLEDYQTFVRAKKETDSKSAVAMLDQANGWLAAGDQEKASLALGNAVRSNQLDAASGEDARVQLRELKTQQAVLGLNTRRQRFAIDNRVATPQGADSQIDRAAEANPVFRGEFNYDPKQFDRFLEGNTADENAALKEIANRIVAQQLAAEPPPVALDVTLPERGTVLTFGRSVQVDGAKPMELTLDLKRSGTGFAWLAAPLCVLLGAIGGWKRKLTA